MTKNELEIIIEEQYHGVLEELGDEEFIRQNIKSSNPNEIAIDSIILSAKICKKMITSVLEQVLPQLSSENEK